MKKIIIATLLSSCLFAEYKVFTNKSEPFSLSQVQKKEVIFFGELKDYQKSLKEVRKNIAAKGVVGAAEGLKGQSANLANGFFKEGLKAGVTGAGIGILYSFLDAPIMSLYADQYYIKVYKVRLNNGRVVFMNKFLVGDKNPKLSKEEIKNILGVN